MPRRVSTKLASLREFFVPGDVGSFHVNKVDNATSSSFRRSVQYKREKQDDIVKVQRITKAYRQFRNSEKRKGVTSCLPNVIAWKHFLPTARGIHAVSRINLTEAAHH